LTNLLFIDESGNDHKESPYEVLAGISIPDRNLWKLIQNTKQIKSKLFGGFYEARRIELKATKIFKTKNFSAR